jgi:multiple sugar transport system substrate-binding protein
VERRKTVRAALVGGPMYDPLYDAIPRFERETGLAVEVVVRLPHPELNAWVKQMFESGEPDIDLLSTHTKYAPSQAAWLAPIDSILTDEHEKDLLERPAALSRIDGRLLQVPRNLDVRLLHYRTDLVGHDATPVPATWNALAEIATTLTTPSIAGFLFPGRDSGLFGTFYELLVSAGGRLFDDELQPAFESREGVWAATFIAELHAVRQVTPRQLPDWHYDEISAAFRTGRAAMVSDWPGSYHLYREATTSSVSDRFALALLPAGPSDARAAYSGCHSFAIPRTSRNPDGGARLLTYLTSFESQLGEARHGAIPCRASALAQVREEASSDPAEATRWRLLAETEETMIIPPRFAAYPLCEDAIWHAIQQAMVGHVTAEQAVARARADVQRIVDHHAGVQAGFQQ